MSRTEWGGGSRREERTGITPMLKRTESEGSRQGCFLAGARARGAAEGRRWVGTLSPSSSGELDRDVDAGESRSASAV